VATLAVTVAPSRLPAPRFWSGRRVLVTGHTGFKGSWLVRWLALLGAEVHGLALEPATSPNLYEQVNAKTLLTSDHRVDLRSLADVRRTVANLGPDVVLHLAAQPLVRDGYRDPAGTFATNVAGTANLLSALHASSPISGPPSAIVVVTTDKVYAASASGDPHVENDPLGGHDPYSASKAMAEGVVSTFRSLPAIDGSSAWTTPIATARAGNVIGGGDWSHERLIPDCIRAFAAGEPVVLRLPAAVRPWQHVLDPLAGYLLLAEDLAAGSSRTPTALNLGPDGDATVEAVARLAALAWGSGAAVVCRPEPGGPPETATLRLDNQLARERLDWAPRWDMRAAVVQTIRWHLAHLAGDDAAEITDAQIREYSGA
jgi:CDP-glucose 4,6-dehydratase